MDAEQRCDDAVVGAGILGLAHAWHLARRGRRVAVFEGSPRAQGASIRNFGMLWPVGQPAGERRELALRSLALWQEVLTAAKLWHARCGSLHLAYREDEAAVLEEFAPRHPEGRLLDAPAALARAPALEPKGLRAALWSPWETCVDPREVVSRLPDWLAREHGVRLVAGRTVRAWEPPFLEAGGERWWAERLFVCPGDEGGPLFPQALAAAGLLRCKLQMLRAAPPAPDWKLGPMLAGGLTLRHYEAFADCPSLPALRARVARESPDLDRFGIHVMASQNGRGELVLGDSHEYGDAIAPFDRVEIEALILDYLAGFLRVPGLRVTERWHGIYAKCPDAPWWIGHPAPGAVVVTGVGGAGMTLSFGLAEQVVEAMS